MINDYFRYNKFNGRFHAREHPSDKVFNRYVAGKEFSDGREKIKIGKERYKVVDLIWKMATGEFPKYMCYLDNDPCNLKFNNLLERRATVNVTSLEDGTYKAVWRGETLGIFKTQKQAVRAKIRAMKADHVNSSISFSSTRSPYSH